MGIGATVKSNFEWDPDKADKNISKNEEKFYQEAG